VGDPPCLTAALSPDQPGTELIGRRTARPCRQRDVQGKEAVRPL